MWAFLIPVALVVLALLLLTPKAASSDESVMEVKFTFTGPRLYVLIRTWWERDKAEHKIRLFYALFIVPMSLAFTTIMWLVFTSI